MEYYIGNVIKIWCQKCKEYKVDGDGEICRDCLEGEIYNADLR